MTEHHDDVAPESEGAPLNNRRDLLRKIALAGAGAAAGTAILANRAAAANTDSIKIGDGTNAGTLPTVLSDAATTALPSPGPSFFSSAEKVPTTSATLAATDVLNIFPAALGGYGLNNIANGVHGSTRAAAGFGVVAANAAAAPASTDTTASVPAALAIGSFASHVRFLPPAAVAAAVGITPAPAPVVGPSGGKHFAGELVVDDDYNLWFSVPGANASDPPVFILLAGQQTAASASFVPLATPVRVYDSRQPSPSPLGGGQSRTLDVTVGKINTATAPAVPAGASAGAFNLTVTNTTGAGNMAIFAAGTPEPSTSNINWGTPGVDVANFAISAVSADGKVTIHSGGGGNADIVLDVTGYYV